MYAIEINHFCHFQQIGGGDMSSGLNPGQQQMQPPRRGVMGKQKLNIKHEISFSFLYETSEYQHKKGILFSIVGMNNFVGGNCPQTNPQSLFGGIQMQQRGQAGMASMTGSSHPPFGVSGLQTNSIQQQAHNQFMINRQGNSIFIFTYTNMSNITRGIVHNYSFKLLHFYRYEQPQRTTTGLAKSKSW